MKHILIIIVIFCVGCSSAIRDRSYVAMTGEGWEIENGRAKYECENTVLSVGSVGESRLIIAGPVIPLVPFSHEYPGYLTIRVSESYTCPTVTLDGLEFESYEVSQYNQNITCQYKLGTLSQSNEIVLELSLGSSCKAKPLRFKRKDNWGYCLVCSA